MLTVFSWRILASTHALWGSLAVFSLFASVDALNHVAVIAWEGGCSVSWVSTAEVALYSLRVVKTISMVFTVPQ